MFWKEKDRPHAGDKKIVKKFLWFPTPAKTGGVRWLEFAYVEYVCVYYRTTGTYWSPVWCWTPEEWDVERETWNTRK